VPTGIAMEIPHGWCGLILPRSSWSDDFDVKTCPIDSDYRGEIHVMLHYTGFYRRSVSHRDRFAQIVIVPHLHELLEEVDELGDTARGGGGGLGAQDSDGDRRRH